jgi:hypothetical protein
MVYYIGKHVDQASGEVRGTGLCWSLAWVVCEGVGRSGAWCVVRMYVSLLFQVITTHTGMSHLKTLIPLKSNYVHTALLTA